MILNLYDFADNKKEIKLSKEINHLEVEVITGDEIVKVYFEDGTRATFDSSDCRLTDYYDDSYEVEKEDIEKWNSFTCDSNISYARPYFKEE